MSNLHSDLAAEAALAGQWFEHLRNHSKGRLGVTRASYGDGEQMAHDLMQAIGQTLGLEKRIDAAGNLYLTLPGRDRSLPSIMTGSHLDSVPEGGNYDGAAGVVAGMAMLARWRRAGRQPTHDITVMGVRAEELSWFPAPYIGSRAAFGLLEPEALDGCRRPDTGRALAQPGGAGFAAERIRAREKQLNRRGSNGSPRAAYRAGAGAGAEGPAGRHRDRHPRQPALSRRPRDRPLRSCRRRAAQVAAGRGAGRRGVRRPAGGRVWLGHEAAGKDLVATVGQFHTDTAVHTMTQDPGRGLVLDGHPRADNAVLLAIGSR